MIILTLLYIIVTYMDMKVPLIITKLTLDTDTSILSKYIHFIK